jgi:two-component system sensor kinase FixL
MSWVTLIWSAAGGATLALACVHFILWCRDRSGWANLALSITALSMVAHAALELGMMYAPTTEAFGTMLRWSHVTAFWIIVGVVVFVRLFFGCGRWWLGAATIGLRLVSLLLNFWFQPNINYRSIDRLDQMSFLGEGIAVVGEAVHNPWMWVAQAAFVGWLAYVVDASWTLWRRGRVGDRQRSLVVGGSTVLFTILGAGNAVLTMNGVTQGPLMGSLFFVPVVFAMGFELSRDVLRAARLSRDLQRSEQRLNLAVSAAGVTLWEMDPIRDRIWLSADGWTLFGIDRKQPLTLDRFLDAVYPDDRGLVRDTVTRAVGDRQPFAIEYRVVAPGGGVRWISGHGNAECDGDGKVTLLRGVAIDMTGRKEAEAEVQLQRTTLMHVSRISTMGELAASMAHELMQPLGSILRNAEAGELFIDRDKPDIAEVRAILADIRQDDQRATAVIERMRSLLKRQDLNFQPVPADELLIEVAAVLRVDAAARKVRLETQAAPALPSVRGDRVHLTQVLLNLVLNAMDAVAQGVTNPGRVIVSAKPHDRAVAFAVTDNGPGIPETALPHIFKPFYTTKDNGMGMGLAIANTIVRAHGGTLTAENNPVGGATFRFTIPASS